ncbi:hypothetical protein B5X24_HaOG203198 [Helicoverpa armigera]|uniref:Uncharacterized protein n=1 Tax=Helicoverpa armigera TaxID=29058 RepID=A0A2W1BVA3_HELAM|nr:hypothetical protein B5X24_HaOG203198 [Helicoverpa armigera]
MLAWACALALLLSAPTSCTSKFYFSAGAYRRAEECHLCFEKDCMTLDQARCDYYAEAEEVLKEDEEDPGGEADPAMRKEVDDLMFDLVAKGVSNNMDCIPYVSRYTNCNKENVCLGCKTCSCDPEGLWNCSIVQPCHGQDPPPNIDHRVLIIAMEALIDSDSVIQGQSHKVKRSVTDSPEDTTSSTITLEQLSEWFYGVKPLSNLKISTTDTPARDSKVTAMDNDKAILTTTERVSTTKTSEATTMVTNTKNTGDTDYVAFDEVLRSIAVDTKAYNRRKPLTDKFNNQSFDVDYMVMDDDNITGFVNDDLSYLVNFMHEDAAEISTESTTKVVIDLLESAGKVNKGNVTEDVIGLNKDVNLNVFENTNDIIDYSAVNIMKRDVSGQENITSPFVAPTITMILNTTNTSKADTNKTEDRMDLKEDILIPLNKIIRDKINELENLKRIKDNLAKIIMSDDNLPEDNKKENNISESHFSIYNLALDTPLNTDLRRSNPNLYEQVMAKFKKDIFEVIRDIILITKHRKSDLPEDLKFLMHAMKRYVYKNKLLEKPKSGKKSKRFKNFRRQMKQYGRCDFVSFKDCLVQVIEAIDNSMAKSNALSPLSPASRRIMKHVILSYYFDENAMPGLRVHDPQYNMTNDLASIGSQWQGMTNSLLSSSPFATLSRMKLLHYVLSSDIGKMNDALGLIDFAHSRRMLPSLDNVSDDVLEKINNGLTAIHNKVQIIIRYYSNEPTTFRPRAMNETDTNTTTEPTDNRQKPNRSFIKHIRTLLQTSKKDIAELLHRKVPKSEIVKQLAKKKLDEISEKRYNEYEETMRRWQKNIEMARFKRSGLDSFKTRIKSIIPNYLRHKVNPKISESKRNATATAVRKADERKKKRDASKRERQSRRSTSPTSSTKKVTPKSKAVNSKYTAVTSKANTAVTKPIPSAKH